MFSTWREIHSSHSHRVFGIVKTRNPFIANKSKAGKLYYMVNDGLKVSSPRKLKIWKFPTHGTPKKVWTLKIWTNFSFISSIFLVVFGVENPYGTFHKSHQLRLVYLIILHISGKINQNYFWFSLAHITTNSRVTLPTVNSTSTVQ